MSIDKAIKLIIFTGFPTYIHAAFENVPFVIRVSLSADWDLSEKLNSKREVVGNFKVNICLLVGNFTEVENIINEIDFTNTKKLFSRSFLHANIARPDYYLYIVISLSVDCDVQQSITDSCRRVWESWIDGRHTECICHRKADDGKWQSLNFKIAIAIEW